MQNLDFRNPGIISKLGEQHVYITVKESDPLVEGYTPHIVYNKKKEYRTVINDGDGLFCPEWGEDLEHLPYLIVDDVDTLRVRNNRIVTLARLRKGTKCFSMPREVCALVAIGKETEASLLKGLLLKHKVKS